MIDLLIVLGAFLLLLIEAAVVATVIALILRWLM